MENKQQIRPHLTKEYRLPKCFKEVEKVLRSVKSCKQNYKTILANSRLRGHVHKKVYSMTVNVLKYYSYIQKIIDNIQLLEKEQYLRREIATVLIYELIFGNGFLPGESKAVKTIQLYENDIFHAHEVLQNKVEDSLIIELNIPRYVRVHTLVTTVQYVIKDLTSYGFHQIIYDNEVSEENYFDLVKNLNKGSFLIDFHFKDILVFEHQENLVSLDLYKNGHIFLQDKSSYIPVHVLNPQPGDAVLDACAAPGMKTIHIAAKMKNKGILIACERDKSRFECLKGMLECGSVKICKTFCKDFKLIDPFDQAYSTIEYILLDPSCSGSGMVNRMDEVTDTENSKNTERLMKLAGFQIILLKHSLKFPAVKRVVYSTCSIHEEENEYVVHEALKAFSGSFKLIPAMPEWSHRGSEKFEFGKLCLRTDPKVHLTNGFFVAVFERISYDDKYIEGCQQNYQVRDGSSFKKQKRKSAKSEENWKKTKTEDYMEMNLKLEYDISPSLRSDQINENVDSCVQNANCELEQNVEYVEHKNEKQKTKKREKSNDSVENKNNESSAQNADCELVQNMEYAQQINKKQKKKKREKSNDSIENKNNESSAQNADCELVQNMEYAQQINKKQKKKKREKSNDSIENKNNESSAQNADCELVQNMEYVEHKNKKQKKKKREKSNDSIENKNNESYAQNADCEPEQNMEYAQQVSRKQKKKKREESNEELNFKSYESALTCSKLKKHSNVSLLENDKNVSTHVKICKSKHDEHHSKSDLYENFQVVEELTDVTKLHKKKKKKKREHFETEMLQSDAHATEKQNMFSEQKQKLSKSKQDDNVQPKLENNSGAITTSKDSSAPRCDYSENFISMASPHKEKKKKKHLNIDYTQTCGKLTEDISLSFAISDNVNTHERVSNMSVNNEIPEEHAELTLLHKKKKKKKHKKSSIENDV